MKREVKMERIKKVVRDFTSSCWDWEGPFKMDKEGLVVAGDTAERLLLPTEWAKEQISKAAGCTPKFYQILADCGEGEIFNKVIGGKKVLLRCRNNNLRALLSPRYDTTVSNVWIVDEVVNRMNFTKILSADDVSLKLTYFTDDYLAISVRSQNSELLIVNGETGRVALSFMIRVFINGAPLTTTIHRKIHTSTDISVTEEALIKGIVTVTTQINALKPEINALKFKIRKVDLKYFPYPSNIKNILFDTEKIKKEGISECALTDVIQNSTKIEDFRWSLIVSCDLFTVCTSMSKYVKEGWLLNWPVRTNWLK